VSALAGFPAACRLIQVTTMTAPRIRTWSVAWVVIAAVSTGTGRADEIMPAAGPSYVLVPVSAKRIKARLTLELKAPSVQAEEWCAYAAQLPELPGQVDVRTTLLPRGKPVRELSDAARPLLFERMPAAGDQRGPTFRLHSDYEATLIGRRLDRREHGGPNPPAIAPLDPKTRRLELKGGHPFDYASPAFRDWLKAQGLDRQPEEDAVDFARRAFLAVCRRITHYEGPDVEHDASRVCVTGKSDFAGITAVYVAALRSAGIPARALNGRVVIYDGQPAKGTWPHAKAEFYAEGLGWVPADVAGAIRSGRADDGLDFFGNDSAEFLTMHIDTDLVVDTYFGRSTLERCLDIALWVKGAGSFDGSRSQVTMTIDVEPLDLAELLARKPTRPGRGPGPGTKRQAAKPPRSSP
jgi:transglutaminase-like putative cysteine protease